MTDTPYSDDQAERLRRLQERRAASGRTRPPRDVGRDADGDADRNVDRDVSARSAPVVTPPKRARRRHPAAATRILCAGLSVTSFFAVAGAIAVANRPTHVAQSVAAAIPATSTAGVPSSAGNAAQPAAATNAVVHTTTGGS